MTLSWISDIAFSLARIKLGVKKRTYKSKAPALGRLEVRALRLLLNVPSALHLEKALATRQPYDEFKCLTKMRAYLELKEVERLEKAATCLRDRLLIRLLFRLGCRISEALALKVEDVDFDRGTVTILHLKARLKLSCAECGQRLGRSHMFCARCGGKVEKAQTERQERHRQRVLPVDNETLSALKDYIRPGGPVLRDGKRLIFGINRHRAWQVVKECAEKAGLPKLVNPETGKVHTISPHKLRDAFAVHAIKLNDSADGLRLLQEHLGHQSFNTTARYRKISGKEQHDWYDKLWQKDSS